MLRASRIHAAMIPSGNDAPLVPSCPCTSRCRNFLCSKDILSRWTFPLVPDDNHPSGHSYEYLRSNTYIAKDSSVVLSR